MIFVCANRVVLSISWREGEGEDRVLVCRECVFVSNSLCREGGWTVCTFENTRTHARTHARTHTDGIPWQIGSETIHKTYTLNPEPRTRNPKSSPLNPTYRWHPLADLERDNLMMQDIAVSSKVLRG